MPAVQSKFAIVRNIIPDKYMKRLTVEFQRTFLVALSLLRTHRRKALLLSLGPATIIKFITVLLPIIKLLPPTIKAIRTLSYFTSSNNSDNNRSNNNTNSSNAIANRDANAAAEGLGLSMDELSEILWTPADDSFWERVNAMVTRFGLCKTLGITLADVRPGRVQIVMPFRAEVSGEGGSFHASLIPTLIAMTSQLAGMTLLPRHFTLKPIDFKCNILSDCEASTFLLVSRGAVVVRGDHSVTVKIEIMKSSGILSGSTNALASPTTSSSSSFFNWKGWANSPQPSQSNSENNGADPLVPGTGIERSKFVVCASGMQTSVIVRAGTDQNDEEENEIQRLKRERIQSLTRSSSSASSSVVDLGGDSIILGDNIVPAARSFSPRPLSPTPKEHTQSISQSIHSSSFEVVSPSSIVTGPNAILEAATLSPATTITVATTSAPFSYAAAVKSNVETVQKFQHIYEETSDTEAWGNH